MSEFKINEYQKIDLKEYGFKITGINTAPIRTLKFGVIVLQLDVHVRIGMHIDLFTELMANSRTWVATGLPIDMDNCKVIKVFRLGQAKNKHLGNLVLQDKTIVGYMFNNIDDAPEFCKTLAYTIAVDGSVEYAASVFLSYIMQETGIHDPNIYKIREENGVIYISYNDFMLNNGKYDIEYRIHKDEFGKYRIKYIGYKI